MKIIISPAKKINEDQGYPAPSSLPQLLTKTQILLAALKSLSYEQLKLLLNTGDNIAKLHFQGYQNLSLQHQTAAALTSYDGIQYKYMAPQVFTTQEWHYVQEHLRILSGFYGVLKPLDGIKQHRLEMGAKTKDVLGESLYSFWGDNIYKALDDDIIINLASEEYAKNIKPYLKKNDTFLTCLFGELSQGKIKEKGVYVKMARGSMVRFMAENRINKIQDLKNFSALGFSFAEKFSLPQQYVFLR